MSSLVICDICFAKKPHVHSKAEFKVGAKTIEEDAFSEHFTAILDVCGECLLLCGPSLSVLLNRRLEYQKAKAGLDEEDPS